jgi:hypothetical protein
MEIDMTQYISPYHKMTDAIRVKIIELWEKEMTGGEISSLLGVSRNSVIGVIYRARKNGNVLREKNCKDANRRAQERSKQIKTKEKKQPILKAEKNVQKIKKTITKDVQNIIEWPVIFEAVSMDDLKYYSCRFIVEEGNYETTKYCGKTINQSSYCKEHYAICYSPSRFSMQKLLRV